MFRDGVPKKEQLTPTNKVLTFTFVRSCDLCSSLRMEKVWLSSNITLSVQFIYLLSGM